MRRMLFLLGLVVLFTAQTFNFVPTQPPGTNNNTPASTAFVQNAVGSSGVTSFKGRIGAVTPAANDYSFSQLSGNIATTQMNNGTGASGTTFWRGDGTWATPSGGGGGGVPGGSNGQVQFNNSGSFGGLTNTQLTADINAFTAGLSGAAPASGGGTINFLRADGSWASPAAGSGTNLGYVSISSFGAVGDGTCHPLSGIYGSLTAAQAVYPFVSDLTQCVDWAATQQAINSAFATAPVTGSNTVYCPAGKYVLSNTIFFDAANNSQGSAAQWASGTTYGNGATVTYNGIPWSSLGSGNIGNAPTSQSFFPANLQYSAASQTPAGFPWALVTITNASPAVFTIVGGGGTGGFVANQPMTLLTQQFAAPNGGAAPALPTGLNANQVYYMIGSSFSGSSFQVSATPGGAAINTSSAGVGSFVMNSQVWQVAPVNGGNSNNRVSFIGDEGINGGCQFFTENDWASPLIIIGPQNGNLVKSINVNGPVPSCTNGAGAPCANNYKCTSINNFATNGSPMTSIGFAVMSASGGASRTLFENTGATGFFYGDYRGYGPTGQLVDSNTWIKPTYLGNCVNISMGETQAFINTLYEGTLGNATTNIIANLQEGMKVLGGNYSQANTLGAGLAASYAITSVSVTTTGNCGSVYFACVQATITSPNNLLQSPMCAYSAGQPTNIGVKWLNAWPYASGCGYATWTLNVPHWGLVGMYIVNYNPSTQVALFGIPLSYAGVYEGACCGSDFTTQVTAQTTIWAAESVISFFGDIQAENIHVESDGSPTTLSCFCTNFFGGVKPAEMKNIYFNSGIAVATNLICCNLAATAQPYWTARFYAQQVIPFINSTLGDTIIDYLVGGNNPLLNNGFFNYGKDRVLMAAATGNYIEGRHTSGVNNQQGTNTGSQGNGEGPWFDFAVGSLTQTPLINPGTKGQLSSGYYAYGGGAFGAGIWDNGTRFGPVSQFSTQAGQQTDMANTWRNLGWGQAPQWGVRPAPWTDPCILTSQVTSLGALPAITFISQLQDFVQVASGGTGYNVNDTITLAGGTFTTAAVLTVTGVSSGAVTSVRVNQVGAYTAEPATTFTQGSTSGGGTGATFTATGPIWQVNYNIGYPLLWGGQLYRECSFTGAAALHSHQWNGTGYSYFQNLTTTNVPHTSWTMDGASPYIYLNDEALQLMFPGLVVSFTGSGGCAGTYTGIVLEVKPTIGYIKTVGASSDGSAYVPALAASGTSCTGTTIGQAAVGTLVQPY